MCTIKMAALSLSIDEIRPLNRWDHCRIQPGNVGSVGDCLVQPRLKHSAPDMPLRFDPYFSHGNSVVNGSNINNGTRTSYASGGGPARTVDSNWGGRRNFKVRNGWIYQDMRSPDTLHEPINTGTPQYSWHNKIATAYEAKRTGNMFLPLPGPYLLHPSETPRGGIVPRIVDDESQERDISLNNPSAVQQASNYAPYTYPGKRLK